MPLDLSALSKNDLDLEHGKASLANDHERMAAIEAELPRRAAVKLRQDNEAKVLAIQAAERHAAERQKLIDGSIAAAEEYFQSALESQRKIAPSIAATRDLLAGIAVDLAAGSRLLESLGFYEVSPAAHVDLAHAFARSCLTGQPFGMGLLDSQRVRGWLVASRQKAER